MSAPAQKRYQNTTVRLPRHVYERAKTVAVQSQASSFNEFVVQAIVEKVRRLTEAEIDAAFAHMAKDENYQGSAIALAAEFEKSDWEAFQSDTKDAQHKREQPRLEQPRREHQKTRAAKTRSR
jgi:hypothetical protein